MKIAALQIGYGIEIENKISLNIYFSGCTDNKSCDRNSCHNILLQNFNEGFHYTGFFSKIDFLLENYPIECMVLLGGEPFDQNLVELKHFMNRYQLYPIYAYTGYKIEQIYELKNQYVEELKFKNICYGHYSFIDNKKHWLYSSDSN